MRAGCGSDRNGKLFMKGFIAFFYVPQKMISSHLHLQYFKFNMQRVVRKTGHMPKRPALSILYEETNHFFFFLCRYFLHNSPSSLLRWQLQYIWWLVFHNKSTLFSFKYCVKKNKSIPRQMKRGVLAIDYKLACKCRRNFCNTQETIDKT